MNQLTSKPAPAQSGSQVQEKLYFLGSVPEIMLQGPGLLIPFIHVFLLELVFIPQIYSSKHFSGNLEFSGDSALLPHPGA